MIYLDYASTTPVRKEVLEAMLPYFSEIYGNPSSIHEKGRIAHETVENARKQVAKIINCSPEEVIFTGGGSESDNLAIQHGLKGIVMTTSIEHHAVLEAMKSAQDYGFKSKFAVTNEEGFVLLPQLKNDMNPEVKFLSVFYANNEIGTIEPIEKIAKIADNNDTVFHTDACQLSF
jgi:cysteine desulfurase